MLKEHDDPFTSAFSIIINEEASQQISEVSSTKCDVSVYFELRSGHQSSFRGLDTRTLRVMISSQMHIAWFSSLLINCILKDNKEVSLDIKIVLLYDSYQQYKESW